MDYRIKRLFGTLFVTALVILVWALITGTAHAQSRASIFTTEQLFQGIPAAQRECLSGDAASCDAVSTIIGEVIKRGALKDSRTPTIDKLRTIVSLNEDCLRDRVCANDPALLVDTLATMLTVNNVTPDDFVRAYESRYSELHALGPVYAPVLDRVYMNIQRARADGL